MAHDVTSEAGADHRTRMARALAEAGYDDVHVLSHEAGRAVFTPERMRVIRRLRDGEVESVSALADALDRDKGAVSRDLSTLASHDLVTFAERGSRKVPHPTHQTVAIEPIYSQ